MSMSLCGEACMAATSAAPVSVRAGGAERVKDNVFGARKRAAVRNSNIRSTKHENAC